MVSIFDKTGQRSGGTFNDEVRTVIVHDGSRGPKGREGDQGIEGDPGASLNVRGEWNTGGRYCPLDAVRARSSLVDHVWSMYVQKSTSPCSISTTEPRLDLARWQEIGPYEWGNYLGGIWEVYQQDHGFTMIGQPVGYSFQVDRYILADCRRSDELPIGVVREVIDDHRVVLQSSGEVPNINPNVILPAGSEWQPGRVYYVSTARGRLQIDQPSTNQYFICPILMPTDVYAPGGGLPEGGRNGVALPWQPAGGPGSQPYITVGWQKYFFTAIQGQTVITGDDDRGFPLQYIVGDSTDVFVNGLNLFDGDFTATDGTTIVLGSELQAGDEVEVWTPDRPLDLIVPSTILKLDNIEGEFDGFETIFNLTVSGQNVDVGSASNVMVWLDGNNQETEVDFNIIPDPDPEGIGSVIEFALPPPASTRFWGNVLAPTPGDPEVIPPTLSALEDIQPAPFGTDDDVALLVRVQGQWKTITVTQDRALRILQRITGDLE